MPLSDSYSATYNWLLCKFSSISDESLIVGPFFCANLVFKCLVVFKLSRLTFKLPCYLLVTTGWLVDPIGYFLVASGS